MKTYRSFIVKYVPTTRTALHVLIALLVTIKILLWNVTKASYVRSIEQSLQFIFTDPILEAPRVQRTDLFGYNETNRYVSQIMTKYQNLNNLSTTEYAYGTKLMDGSLNCVHEPLPVEWTSCQWISTDQVECSSVNTLQLDQSTLTSADYYNRLDSFKLSFDLCNYVNSFGVNHDCHYWRVVVTFRSVSLMYLQATVATQLINECEQSQTVAAFSSIPSNWINIFTIVLGVWYLIYIIQDIVESVRIYRAVKEAHRKAREIYLNKRAGEFVEHDIAAKYSWEEIPRGVKRSFHNYWSVFSLVAVVLAIIQACISLSDPYDDLENLEDGQKALVGICVLFLWMAVVQFIPVQSQVYALAATIQTAFPRIFAFLLTFLPVFLAFVFFGIALFGSELGAFGSVDRAAKFIFTLMAGDSVMQIMQLVSVHISLRCLSHSLEHLPLTCTNR